METLLSLITHLIGSMIRTSKIPDPLKVSCITPVFKKGEVNVLSNYRPIGSMNFLEKVFEKHLDVQIESYVVENNIIPKFQHGFQTKKSTTTLLQDFADTINQALDQRKVAVIIWIDLSRAYDTINHARLLEKFKDLGLSQKIFMNFFNNRKARTKVGKYQSTEENITNGLVQGGITSPRWYNMYTYDIKYVGIEGKLLMFADDSCIIAIHKNLENAVTIAQKDLINIQKYFYNNDIYINHNKTESMVIGYLRNRHEIKHHLIRCHSRECLQHERYAFCFCPTIQYSPHCRYLGIQIDYLFNFAEHINNISKKIRILNYKMNKNQVGTLPMHAKKILYFTLVESIVRYGVTLYGNAPAFIMRPLISAQKLVLNSLFSISHDDQRKTFMSPIQLYELVTLVINWYEEGYRKVTPVGYHMRRQQLVLPRVFTKFGEKTSAYVVPKLLNKYGLQFQKGESVQAVKRRVKYAIVSHVDL